MGRCCKKRRRAARRRPDAKNQGQDTGMNDKGDKTKAHTSLADRLRDEAAVSFPLFAFSVVVVSGGGRQSVNNDEG